MDQNELMKLTMTAQIAGNVAGALLNTKQATTENVATTSVIVAKEIISQLYENV